MRTLLLPLAVAAALLSSPASAQTTGVVTVGGNIVPSSCSMSLSNGGVVNYGTITFASFNGTGGIAAFSPRFRTLTVSCSGLTQVSLKIRDNRQDALAGSSEATSAIAFGLGRNTAGDRSLGYWRITPAANVTINPGNQTVALLRSADRSTWVSNGSARWAKSNLVNGPTWYEFLSPGVGTAISSITSATFDLTIETFLNPTSSMRLTQATALDSSATIELEYL